MKPTATPPRIPPTTPEELNKQLLERMESIDKASKELQKQVEYQIKLEAGINAALKNGNRWLAKTLSAQLDKTEESTTQLKAKLKEDKAKSESTIGELNEQILQLKKTGNARDTTSATTLQKKLDALLTSSTANNETMRQVVATTAGKTREQIARAERLKEKREAATKDFRDDKLRINAASRHEAELGPTGEIDVKGVKRRIYQVRAPSVKAIIANTSSIMGKHVGGVDPGSFLSAMLAGVESLFYIHTTGNRSGGYNRRRSNDGSERSDQTSPAPQIRSGFVSKLITVIRSASEKTIVQRFTDMQRSGASDIAEAVNKLGLNFIKEKMLKLGSFVGEKFSKLGSFIKTNLTLVGARTIGRILEKIPLNKIFNFFSAIVGPVAEKLRSVGTLVGGIGKIVTGTVGKIIMALSPMAWIKDFLKSPVSWFLIAMVVGYVMKLINDAKTWVMSNFENMSKFDWWLSIFAKAGNALWGATIGRLTGLSLDAVGKKISDIIGDVTAWVKAIPSAISTFFTNTVWYKWTVPFLNKIIDGINFLLPARYEISKLSKDVEESALRKYELAAQTGKLVSTIATPAEMDIIVAKIKSGEIKPVGARREELHPVLNTSPAAAAAMKNATITPSGDVTVNTDTTKFDESAKDIAAKQDMILAAIAAAQAPQQNITVFSTRSKSSEEYMGSLVPA